jgi:hypothetical protein
MAEEIITMTIEDDSGNVSRFEQVTIKTENIYIEDAIPLLAGLFQPSGYGQ